MKSDIPHLNVASNKREHRRLINEPVSGVCCYRRDIKATDISLTPVLYWAIQADNRKRLL